MDIVKRTAEYIRSHDMINASGRVIAGVSGGADSLGLLILLVRIKQSGLLGRDFEILPCHVNHHIRGESADKDEKHAVLICERLGLNCRCEHVDALREAQRTGESLEEAARRLRYKAFVKAANEQGADSVALAHHMNDQAETVLFNMIRGSGVRGLAGIAPAGSLPFDDSGRIQAIRPLLFLKKNELEEYLISEGMTWREDETNHDVEYARNRIRHNLMPEAEMINERAADHIARLAGDMEKLSSYLDRETEKAFAKYAKIRGREVELDTGIFENEHEVIHTRVVRECIKKSAGKLKDITSVHVADAESLARGEKSGKSVDLPYGLKVLREYDHLIFRKVSQEPGAEPETRQRILAGDEIPRGEDGVPRFPIDGCIKWFDYDKIKSPVCFRSPRNGDRIVINGGTQSLRDFFKKQKVPVSERERALVLATEEGEVLWVFTGSVSRVSVSCLTDENTERILETAVLIERENDYEQ